MPSLPSTGHLARCSWGCSGGLHGPDHSPLFSSSVQYCVELFLQLFICLHDIMLNFIHVGLYLNDAYFDLTPTPKYLLKNLHMPESIKSLFVFSGVCPLSGVFGKSDIVRLLKNSARYLKLTR